MLSSIRNNRKALSIVLWLVIIAFVATIFVVWGVGEKTSSSTYAVKVGDKVITENEFIMQNRVVEEELKRFGGEIDNLSAYVLQSMIEKKVLLMEADKLDIPVTKAEIQAYISSMPAFQINGVFNMQQYEAVLKNNRTTPAAFEANASDELKLMKIRGLIYQSQSVVSQKEVENEYNYRMSTINLDYATVPLKSFENKVSAEPTDAELQEYYNLIKEAYRVPAEIKLKYAAFNKDKFIENYEVSDEIAQNFYNNNKAIFNQGEGAEVSMISIPVNANDNESDKAALAIINKAYDELKSGKAFAEVANTYNDTNVSPVDGYMGVITKGTTKFDVENVIFNTKAESYSPVTKVSDGYIIVYVHKLVPAKEFTFEEKKDEIKATIKQDAGRDAFNTYTLNEYTKILNNTNITELLKKEPEFASFVTTEDNYITEKDTFFLPQAKENLFMLDKGGVSQRIETDNVTYIFEVEDKKPSYIPELAEVKQQLLIDYKVDKITKEGIKALESDIAGEGFEKTAAKYNSQVKKLSFVRSNADLESLFKGDVALVATVQNTKSGQALQKPYLLDDNFYIFKVSSITPADMAKLNDYKDTIQNFIASVKGETAITSYVSKAMEKVEVKYNKDFLNRNNITIQK